MNAAAWIVLVVAGVAATADWVAVWRRPAQERTETVLKPLVLVLLVVAAVVIDPLDADQRTWFVVALVLSLVGDVFLLPSIDRFVPGLASFLLAHVAYIVGFAQVAEVSESDRVVAWLVLLPIAPVAFVVHAAVLRTEPELRIPVLLYISVIAAMVVWSVIAGGAVAIAGAVTFATSDSILALDRFERHRRWMPTAVMVTYHVAQVLLVASLVQSR